jgi:hypothetical protein
VVAARNRRRAMALVACRKCGHYYVTEDEVEEWTCCLYCHGDTRPADASEATSYIRRLLSELHETAKGWTSTLAVPTEEPPGDPGCGPRQRTGTDTAS